MTPNHCVYLTGIALQPPPSIGSHVEVSASEDGNHWHKLLDSSSLGFDAKGIIACRSKVLLRWFKLHLKAGSWRGRMHIHGIVQSPSCPIGF